MATVMLSPTETGIEGIGVSDAGRISHHGVMTAWPSFGVYRSSMPAWINVLSEFPSTPTHSVVSDRPGVGLRAGTLKVPRAPVIPKPSNTYPDQLLEVFGSPRWASAWRTTTTWRRRLRAVKRKIQRRARTVRGTRATYEPRHATGTGLRPLQNAGATASVQDVAPVATRRIVTVPPV